MFRIITVLFRPWQLSKVLTGGRPFRLLELHIASGLLIIPTFFMTIWFAEQLETRFADQLPAPQAGLMATMAEGIMQGVPDPPAIKAAKITTGIFGWLIGGVASGLLIVALFGSTLSGLRGKQQDIHGPSAWRMASSASMYLPLAVVPGVLWFDVYSGIKTGQTGQVPLEIVFAALFSLWFMFGLGSLAWGWLRHALQKSKPRAAFEAVLFCLLSWFLVWLAITVAWTLTWVPVKLVQRMIA
ncbi:MAG: hypothetical protein JRJ19_04210 [Deltaproteobacteria bacterium]|nr:hypothetical protein [Deltaproteobacteria bacterium]MBW1871243.1 hypothetical protein [Deltaproteobacteria bacterium]